MTARSAFESVDQRHQRDAGVAGVHPVEIDEVAVVCFPALATIWRRPALEREARIDGLQMAARQPPGRAVGRHQCRTDGGASCGAASGASGEAWWTRMPQPRAVST